MSTDIKDRKAFAAWDDARKYWLDEGRGQGGIVPEVDHSNYIEGRLHPLLEGIKIIDCDAHFTEPPDIFIRNAPAHLKDRMPRVEMVNGAVRWFVGDKDFGSYGGNTVSKDRNKLLGRLSFTNFEEIHPGSWQVKPRLEEMDKMGIWAQICYVNAGVTQAGSLLALNDEELTDTIVRVFNDGCLERQYESGGRLMQMAMLPYWDGAKMLAEARRVIDKGGHGFVLPDRPERAGLPFLKDPKTIHPVWEEFFEMACAANLPLTFHLNTALDSGSAMWDNFGFHQHLVSATALHTLASAVTMANFMVSGILDKYENLKIGMIESGIGWVPFWTELLDHQFYEMQIHETIKLKKSAREYFDQNFWVTFWFEKNAPQINLEAIGYDRVMFETDWPHPTCIYPGMQERIIDAVGHLDFEIRKKVLQDNAATCFNITVD